MEAQTQPKGQHKNGVAAKVVVDQAVVNGAAAAVVAAVQESKFRMPTSTPVVVVGSKVYAVEIRNVKGRELVTVAEVESIHDVDNPLVTKEWNSVYNGTRFSGSRDEIRKLASFLNRIVG